MLLYMPAADLRQTEKETSAQHQVIEAPAD